MSTVMGNDNVKCRLAVAFKVRLGLLLPCAREPDLTARASSTAILVRPNRHRPTTEEHA